MVRDLNVKYRDTVFRMLFGEDKEALLSIYNALNGTDYSDAEDLEINTLEDSVYMGIKNDVSFIVRSEMEMVLTEHQSTINPNMPLRDLFYVANLLEIYTADMNIFGRTKLTIPAPRFIVLYNGDEEVEDKKTYSLSDMYAGGKEGDLELKVTVYNINLGHNKYLMDGCRILKEYSIFVDKIKKYKKDNTYKSIKYATDWAVRECLEEGILVDFLRKHKVEEMAMNVLFEFDAKRQSEMDRRDGIEEGRASIIQGALKNGSSPELISKVIGIPLDEVLKVQSEMLEKA